MYIHTHQIIHIYYLYNLRIILLTFSNGWIIFLDVLKKIITFTRSSYKLVQIIILKSHSLLYGGYLIIVHVRYVAQNFSCPLYMQRQNNLWFQYKGVFFFYMQYSP